MAEPRTAEPSSLARALGGIPSGLFILTARHGEQATGMLASWVQQAGFEPPAVSVAVRRDRYIVDWIAETRRLTLNQVPATGKGLLRHFGKGFDPDEPAFDGITLRDEATAGPVLGDALAYLDVMVTGSVDSGDHRVFLAEVLDGKRFDPNAEPMIHVRKSGLHY